MKGQHRGAGKYWLNSQTKWHCEGQSMSENVFLKLRLWWWILIPWALRKTAGRKALSGSILVPVPKLGLWWHLSLYIQLLGCLQCEVMLSFLRGQSFPGSLSLLNPWGIPVWTRQSSFCLRSIGIPSRVPCAGFELMAQPRGAPHRVLPMASHTSSSYARKEKKTRLNVLEKSASKDPDLCTVRTQKSETQRCQPSCYAVPSLCPWRPNLQLPAISSATGMSWGSQRFGLWNGLITW